MCDYKVIRRNLILPIGPELDHHQALRLRRISDEQLRRSRAQNVILDFKETRFMDSAGVGMIIGRYREVDLLGGKLCAIHVGKNVRKLVDISGLHKLLYIYKDLNEALAHL